jgi:hypothetical protein
LAAIPNSSHWLRAFKEIGLIDEIKVEKEASSARVLTPHADLLLDMEPEVAIKFAFFQFPSYRRYLLGILAEGLVMAAQANMINEIETWSGGVLLPVLGELNQVFDILEKNGRLIEKSLSNIHQLCDELPERNFDWAHWNQFLLGQTGRPQDLFDFAIKRFVPYACISTNPSCNSIPALIRRFPLNADEGFSPSRALQPAPWNIRRSRVKSGIALFDCRGDPLTDMDLPTTICEALQNGLLNQPFYKAVVHLAISAWRSPAINAPSIEFFVPTGESLSDVSVLFAGRKVGKLADLLPDLVTLQAFHVHGLGDGPVPPELMGNLLKNLLALNILCQIDESLELHHEFKSSLMAARLRTVFRSGKKLQERMLEFLSQRRTGVLENA